MKKEYPCEFVQDMMPAFIEGAVSAESADMIKVHISSCEKCTSIFEGMNYDTQTDLSDAGEGKNLTKDDLRVVDYMKKIRKRRRSISILMAALAVIISVSSILIIRENNYALYGEPCYDRKAETITWPKDTEWKSFT